MYEINLKKPVHVYFIGIGGISMSGLAQLLLSEGFNGTGSDRSKSPLTDRLEGLGGKTFILVPKVEDGGQVTWTNDTGSCRTGELCYFYNPW